MMKSMMSMSVHCVCVCEVGEVPQMRSVFGLAVWKLVSHSLIEASFHSVLFVHRRYTYVLRRNV